MERGPRTLTPHPASQIARGVAALADAAHHGLRHHAGPQTRTCLREAADRLARTGLDQAAARLRTLLDAATPGAWLDAQLHLLVSAEVHEEAAPSRGTRRPFAVHKRRAPRRLEAWRT